MTSNLPIRIFVSHTDAIAQAGLSSACRNIDDFEVVEHCVSSSAYPVDIVATDFESGLALLSSPMDSDYGKVLIITTNDRESDIRLALKKGAKGYLLQGCSLEELATAIRQASAGSVYVGTHIAHRLAESIFEESLTLREEEVLQFVVEGFCNKEIARELGLAVGTIKSHLRTVFGKLNVKSRTHAVAVAERRGLVSRGRRLGGPGGRVRGSTLDKIPTARVFSP
ncbi:hypothetical protein RD110_22050 [Rhodoferax koreense]|uniref:HTH luxR-type domain-containing protein n=1 Tax=Rhodoferax koreensis TaxID=1842727 RepID=A0A1P8K0P1_9BURK|nr:response regulator transcription factor [Rhodoferax koreense]APW39566.1 hypothetical protein RD110_22050 [Rhodoferax koreense]